jgi:hypothetical protein
MQKKPLINAVDEVLSKAKAGFDEKTDKVQENPDSGPERPDEKASVKKAKKSTEDSSMASDDPEEVVSESIEMSKASIKSIVKHANGLMMGINETNQSCLSEGWVASKITIIEDYLRTIHDYVMYYEEEDEEEGDE